MARGIVNRHKLLKNGNESLALNYQARQLESFVILKHNVAGLTLRADLNHLV